MRRYILIFLLSFVCAKSQTKLNNKDDIEFFLMCPILSYKNLLEGKEPQIKVINRSDITYIIDPYGFKQKNIIYDSKQNIVFPTGYISTGYYQRFNDQQCQNDFIIIMPREEKYISLSIFVLNGMYDLKNDEKYVLKLDSSHNRYTAIQYGCDNFIKKLETKGYKVLEDTINIKISLIP